MKYISVTIKLDTHECTQDNVDTYDLKHITQKIHEFIKRNIKPKAENMPRVIRPSNKPFVPEGGIGKGGEGGRGEGEDWENRE